MTTQFKFIMNPPEHTVLLAIWDVEERERLRKPLSERGYKVVVCSHLTDLEPTIVSVLPSLICLEVGDPQKDMVSLNLIRTLYAQLHGSETPFLIQLPKYSDSFLPLEWSQSLADKLYRLFRKGEDVWSFLSYVGRLIESKLLSDALKTKAQQALHQNPHDSLAYLQLGKSYNLVMNSSQAIDAYQQALKNDPNLTEAHFQLGAILEQKHRYSEAIEEYREAVRSFPAYAAAYLQLGYIYERLQQINLACAAFRSAVQFDSGEIGIKAAARLRHHNCPEG